MKKLTVGCVRRHYVVRYLNNFRQHMLGAYMLTQNFCIRPSYKHMKSYREYFINLLKYKLWMSCVPYKRFRTITGYALAKRFLLLKSFTSLTYVHCSVELLRQTCANVQHVFRALNYHVSTTDRGFGHIDSAC